MIGGPLKWGWRLIRHDIISRTVMERAVLETLLANVDGCTFATLDAETFPVPGFRKVVTGKRIILFTNKKVSGYENMVKRRLIEAGKNPADFVLGDLSWGHRIPSTPLIEHKGKVYLQCIELSEGEERFFTTVSGIEVNKADIGLRERRTGQGLAKDDEILVSCYDLKHITRIALAGETIVSEAPSRSVLRLNI
jgi:hypothetical protein